MLARAGDAFRARLASASHGQRGLIAAALGAGSALAFAPLFLWPMFLLAVVGAIWLIDTGRTPASTALLGWWFGFGHFALGLYWLAIAFQFQAQMPAWLGWLAVGGLSALLALYPALAFWASARLWSRSPLRVLAFAALWGAAEWLRGHLLTGFPWNGAAQLWADSPAVMQIARLVGSYGLSFLTVAFFACVALVVDRSRQARLTLITASIVAAAILIDGTIRLNSDDRSELGLVRVHLVQAAVSQGVKNDPASQFAILELHEQMTATALRTRGAGLVVWPESALRYDIEGDGVTRFRLGTLVAPDGLLVLGAERLIFADSRVVAARNSLLVVNGTGGIESVYDKSHLVPFGEYLPLARLLEPLGFRRMVPGSAIFRPGDGPVTIERPSLAPFSPLICYEIIFAGAVVDPGHRPAWLLNISNDAWFGLSSGPYQHLAQAQLRAVEEGLAVARSTSTGITAIIDPYGRVVAHLPLGERGVLTGNIPPPLPSPFYARFSDLPVAVLFAAFLCAALMARRIDQQTRTSAR